MRSVERRQVGRRVKAKPFVQSIYTHTRSPFYANEMCKIVRAHARCVWYAHTHTHLHSYLHTLVVIELATAVTRMYVMRAMNSRSKRRLNVNDSVREWVSEWAIYSLYVRDKVNLFSLFVCNIYRSFFAPFRPSPYFIEWVCVRACVCVCVCNSFV